jgi:hypothetical protein
MEWVHWGGLRTQPTGGTEMQPPFYSERKQGTARFIAAEAVG